MKYRHYTEGEILEKTREAIHHFTNKEIEPFLAVLDKDFIWIGDYAALFTRGIPAFLDSIQEESQEPPVKISEEEYALSSHEKHLWVTHGRFVASYRMEDGELLESKAHFSFTWRQTENDLWLVQAIATHVRDGLPDTPRQTQSLIFDIRPPKQEVPRSTEGRKLEFRGIDKRTRYLSPSEIYYIQSHNNICEIVTQHGSFTVRATLKSLEQKPFFMVHQSYLVNTGYIDHIYRYRAVLLDGSEIPIGKERYMDLRQFLQRNSSFPAISHSDKH